MPFSTISWGLIAPDVTSHLWVKRLTSAPPLSHSRIVKLVETDSFVPQPGSRPCPFPGRRWPVLIVSYSLLFKSLQTKMPLVPTIQDVLQAEYDYIVVGVLILLLIYPAWIKHRNRRRCMISARLRWVNYSCMMNLLVVRMRRSKSSKRRSSNQCPPHRGWYTSWRYRSSNWLVVLYC